MYHGNEISGMLLSVAVAMVTPGYFSAHAQSNQISPTEQGNINITFHY